MLSSITNFFTGKKNTLPTTNTRRVTGAPANATVINVARPEQQAIPSRSVSPSFNTSAGATGATAPVIKNIPNNAVAINMQGPGMLGGRRKSKSKKSKKAKKSKKSKKSKSKKAKKATHRK